jgi:putative phosphoribosyl transferase
MLRFEVLDQHERHAGFGRQRLEQRGERREATCRSADGNHREGESRTQTGDFIALATSCPSLAGLERRLCFRHVLRLPAKIPRLSMERQMLRSQGVVMQLPFRDREEAGRLLGAELAGSKLPADAIVLALPRGGVPVGLAIASILRAPLDVVVVRKLGVPWQPELAMGAIAGGTVPVLDQRLIHHLRIAPQGVDAVVAREKAEIVRRENLYRGGRPAPDLRGRTVVLVDDGLATGSTMAVSARYVRGLNPGEVIIAVPVASSAACRRMSAEADRCICLAQPEPFESVSQWYADFRQVSDAEVQSLLSRVQEPRRGLK